MLNVFGLTIWMLLAIIYASYINGQPTCCPKSETVTRTSLITANQELDVVRRVLFDLKKSQHKTGSNIADVVEEIKLTVSKVTDVVEEVKLTVSKMTGVEEKVRTDVNKVTDVAEEAQMDVSNLTQKVEELTGFLDEIARSVDRIIQHVGELSNNISGLDKILSDPSSNIGMTLFSVWNINNMLILHITVYDDIAHSGFAFIKIT